MRNLNAEQLPFYDPLQDGVIAIAHRGGDDANSPNSNKENTLAAFESAQRLGFKYCETGIATTSDGVPLAFHGSGTLYQGLITNPGAPTRGHIEKLTFDQTRKIRIGGEEIPTLAEVIWSLPDMRFFIDSKTERSVDALADVIDRTQSYDRVCVGAFRKARNERFANIMRAKERRVAITLSLGECASVTRLLGTGHAERARAVVNSAGGTSWTALQYITGPMVDKLHDDLGLPVFAHIWPPSEISSEQMDAHLEKGIDGLMGNQSKMIIDAVKRYNDKQ